MPTFEFTGNFYNIAKGHLHSEVEAYRLQHQAFYCEQPLAIELDSLGQRTVRLVCALRQLYDSTDLWVHIYLPND